MRVTTLELRLNRKRINLLLYVLIFTMYAFSTACTSSEQAGKSEQHVVETTTSTPSQATTASSDANAQPTSTPPALVESTAPPPKPQEVRAALARIYKDAVKLDMSYPPGYIIGDFNGDGSQDIAVVVRPAKDKIEEINSELANWILEDPRQVVLPDPHKSVQKLPSNSESVKVKPNALLLTIIHGYKEEGWRNPEAKQVYLLSNAVGSAMVAAPLKDLQSATGNKNEQSLSGDIIKETLAGEQGFLYWTGAKYAWHKKQ
ncbi:MAG: hypothetical protein QOC96_1377 [Acidobacteriota bacterium]|nr:hypothetical protein [Acidobacteriota bacterium]